MSKSTPPPSPTGFIIEPLVLSPYRPYSPYERRSTPRPTTPLGRQQTHFTFVIGEDRTHFPILKSKILSYAGKPFHDDCQARADRRADAHIHLPDIELPVFAVFAQMLDGEDPPLFPCGWLKAAGQDPLRADAPPTSVYPMELYVFVCNHGIAPLLQRARYSALGYLNLRRPWAIPAVAIATAKLRNRGPTGDLEPEDTALQLLVASYGKNWMKIPADVKELLPHAFVTMVLRALTDKNVVTIVTRFRAEEGRIRMEDMDWIWKDGKALVKLCDWFAKRDQRDWVGEAEDEDEVVMCLEV